MRNAVILHGKPSRERYFDDNVPKPHKANWFPWIAQKLEDTGVPTSVPPLPEPYFPVYEAWEEVLSRQDINEQTGLVGHSAGSELILRKFSEDKKLTAERIVLVAPYRDYAGKYGDFSKFTPDSNLPERIGRLTIINSLDDDEPIQRRTQELVDTFPGAKLIELDGYGHFRIGHNMKLPDFPLLLDELTK